MRASSRRATRIVVQLSCCPATQCRVFQQPARPLITSRAGVVGRELLHYLQHSIRTVTFWRAVRRLLGPWLSWRCSRVGDSIRIKERPGNRRSVQSGWSIFRTRTCTILPPLVGNGGLMTSHSLRASESYIPRRKSIGGNLDVHFQREF